MPRGIPKRDGSGGGKGNNKGRGGCKNPSGRNRLITHDFKRSELVKVFID